MVVWIGSCTPAPAWKRLPSKGYEEVLKFRSHLSAVVLALATVFIVGAASGQNQIFDPRSLAPFVPTPERVVERMLEIAEVSKDDVVYDIGSGDGRILITAAQDFKSKAVGIELNEILVKDTQRRVKELGLEDKIEVVQADAIEADLSGATVVTVYLLTASNEQLRPKLERELAPGARVVSHDFQFSGWQHEAMEEVEGQSRRHRVYLYRMPDKSE